MQQLEGAEGRFGDALQRQQAEAALKRRGRHVVFLEDVAERPVAVALHKAAAFHHGLDNDGRRVRLVVEVIARVRRRTPFRVVDRLSVCLVVRLLRPFAKDAPFALGQLRLGVFAH